MSVVKHTKSIRFMKRSQFTKKGYKWNQTGGRAEGDTIPRHTGLKGRYTGIEDQLKV